MQATMHLLLGSQMQEKVSPILTPGALGATGGRIWQGVVDASVGPWP